MAIQNFYFFVLKPFCSPFGGMLRIHCPAERCIYYFNIHIIIFLREAINWIEFIQSYLISTPSCSKTTPQHDAASLVVHVWDSLFVSSDQRTFLQKVISLSQRSFANFIDVFSGRFWSSFLLGEQPFRLWRYSAISDVDVDTFVPVTSNISTSSLNVVLGMLLNIFTPALNATELIEIII